MNRSRRVALSCVVLLPMLPSFALALGRPLYLAEDRLDCRLERIEPVRNSTGVRYISSGTCDRYTRRSDVVYKARWSAIGTFDARTKVAREAIRIAKPRLDEPYDARFPMYGSIEVKMTCPEDPWINGQDWNKFRCAYQTLSATEKISQDGAASLYREQKAPFTSQLPPALRADLARRAKPIALQDQPRDRVTGLGEPKTVTALGTEPKPQATPRATVLAAPISPSPASTAQSVASPVAPATPPHRLELPGNFVHLNDRATIQFDGRQTPVADVKQQILAMDDNAIIIVGGTPQKAAAMKAQLRSTGGAAAGGAKPSAGALSLQGAPQPMAAPPSSTLPSTQKSMTNQPAALGSRAPSSALSR